jgi:hypothetical protein
VITQESKLERLIHRLDGMVSSLGKHPYDIAIHRRIDQFYYMEKREQLEVLRNQLTETLEKLIALQSKIESEYTHVSGRWCEDVRWMNRYLNGFHEHITFGRDSCEGSTCE